MHMKINLTATLFIILLGTAPLYSQDFDSVAYLEPFLDLKLTQVQRDSLRDGLYANQERIRAIHEYGLSNETPPALVFMPLFFADDLSATQETVDWNLPTEVSLPKDKNDLAYYTVEQLGVLVRDRKITSVELTEFFLNRLKKFGDTLQCIVSLTEERAMERARRADMEIAQGTYRGPLHGIPYGLKDLFAVEGTITSWGAMPYKEQEIEATATIVKKLDEAGAVLVGKLTLGALAMGDVWYGGITKNPWNMEQGSSGSSAGSASAVSAGLVPFAIGTETLGSIVSPSTRCGTTGLRPTFGRVSRYGGMALSWSMDKVGPIARSAKDCALVFDVIRGSDQQDPTVVDAPFNYSAKRDFKSLRVGYLEGGRNSENDSITLANLREMGVSLTKVELPADIPIYPLTIILASEASAAFDGLTRSGKDSLMVRQDKGAWPNYFRTSRFIPAVDYVNANRIRTRLIREMEDLMEEYDVIVAPSFSGQLVLTNLTGHPCLVLPNGFDENGSPTSISFIGKMMGEASLITLGEAFQAHTGFDDVHPEYFQQ
jgi:Asp-tRNA(Asn)/Glu-tRNA(Gln) amidotransferase A subunit family amidase